MTCGRTGDDYAARVQRFDWKSFYRKCEGSSIIETLKLRLRERADIILVDARAGQTDIGAIATIQIPDVAVLMFTSNRQNLEGVAEMARRLKHHPARKNWGADDLRLLLVPSRIFVDADGFSDWFARARGVYDALRAEGVVSQLDQPKGIQECILPINQRYSFSESVIVFDNDADGAGLRRSYFDLSQAINNILSDYEPWPVGVVGAGSSLDSAVRDMRRLISNARRRGDDRAEALLSTELSLKYFERADVKNAKRCLSSARKYFSLVRDSLWLSAVDAKLGRAALFLLELDNADNRLDSAVKNAGCADGSVIKAHALYDRGRVFQVKHAMAIGAHCTHGDNSFIGRAEAYMTEALQELDDDTYIYPRAYIQLGLATILLDQAKYDEIERHCRNAWKSFLDVGHSIAQARVARLLGQFYREIGRYSEARTQLDTAIELSRGYPYRCRYVMSCLEQARLSFVLGELGNARDWRSTATDHFAASNVLEYDRYWYEYCVGHLDDLLRGTP